MSYVCVVLAIDVFELCLKGEMDRQLERDIHRERWSYKRRLSRMGLIITPLTSRSKSTSLDQTLEFCVENHRQGLGYTLLHNQA